MSVQSIELTKILVNLFGHLLVEMFMLAWILFKVLIIVAMYFGGVWINAFTWFEYIVLGGVIEILINRNN